MSTDQNFSQNSGATSSTARPDETLSSFVPSTPNTASTTITSESKPITVSSQGTTLSAPAVTETLADFLRKPLFVGTVNFPTTYTITNLTILTSYLGLIPVATRLAFFRHMRATVCMRVEMPVNAHYFGEVHCSLTPPISSTNGTFNTDRMYQIEPSAVFNANTGAPVTVKYKYFWHDPKLSLQNSDSTIYCQANFSTLTPLSRDDGVALGTPALNIFCWLEDVELFEDRKSVV